MDIQTFATVLVTLITVLGSGAAWRYYEKKLSFRLQEKKIEEIEDTMHITDLRKRIEKLEKLLEDAKDEKDTLRSQLIKLSSETAAMRTELEYLIKENKLLRAIISPIKKKSKKK